MHGTDYNGSITMITKPGKVNWKLIGKLKVDPG